MNRKKQFLVVFLLLMFSKAVHSRNFTEIDSLISSKKYQTAYSKLEELKSEDPDKFAKQIEITINYYVLCINAKLFALTDLKANENIEKIRGTPGTYKMVNLDIEKTGQSLAKKFPQNVNLQKALADYFYAPPCAGEEAQIELAAKYYGNAVKLGLKDSKAFHNLGVISIHQQKYSEAKKYFEDALKIDPKYAGAYYNLAIVEENLKNNEAVAKNAKKAFELYDDKKLKGEAAILATFGFLDSNNKKEALNFLSEAYKLKDGNAYYILVKSFGIYCELKQWDNASKLADELFALEPTNPKLVQDTVKQYNANKARDQMDKFFERNLTKYKSNYEALGNLLFHKALVLCDDGNKDASKKTFEQAKSYFTKVLKPDHEVFKALKENLEQCSK